jgi:hypothetical protein
MIFLDHRREMSKPAHENGNGSSGRRRMTVYMVERSLPGMAMEALAAAQKAAIAQAAVMRRRGTDIHYIRSTFVPGDGRCMCLFEARSEDAVRRLNNDANIPYNTVTEAYDLTPRPAGDADEHGAHEPPLGLAVS